MLLFNLFIHIIYDIVHVPKFEHLVPLITIDLLCNVDFFLNYLLFSLFIWILTHKWYLIAVKIVIFMYN